MDYSIDNYLLELNEGHPRLPGEQRLRVVVSIPDRNSSLISSVSSSPLFKKHNLLLKRSFDIVASLLMIVLVLWWLLPILALLIKLDSRGPVFFVQKRNKKNGDLFNCIKLRTMLVNDRAHTHSAVANDYRITRFGRFLRASYLDELPQFFNVLKGDMSVVGPRPHMITDNVKFKKILRFYNDRHFVKPGITGLAQSYGYNGPIKDILHLNKKIEYDIFYIKNWSVGMDVKIVFRTMGMILKN